MFVVIRNMLLSPPTKGWSRKVREQVSDVRIGYIKNLITLSSGTLLLSFTIFQVFSDDLVLPRLLILAWVLLTFSIACGLFAYTSIIHDDLYWKIGERILNGKTTADLTPEK